MTSNCKHRLASDKHGHQEHIPRRVHGDMELRNARERLNQAEAKKTFRSARWAFVSFFSSHGSADRRSVSSSIVRCAILDSLMSFPRSAIELSAAF